MCTGIPLRAHFVRLLDPGFVRTIIDSTARISTCMSSVINEANSTSLLRTENHLIVQDLPSTRRTPKHFLLEFCL